MAIIPLQVLLGWEDTFGTTPASPTPYNLCVKSNGLINAQETEVVDCIGGDIDSGGSKIVTGTTNAGDLEATAYWEQIGVYLKAILGEPATVDNSDGTYTHTFVTSKDDIPSMYIETISGASDELIEVFNGVMGTTYNTSFSGKGIPQVKLGLLASTHKDNLKDSYTKMSTSGAIALASTALNMMYTYVKVDTSDFCKVSEFDITFDRGTESEDLLCDTKDVTMLKSDVSGNLKSIFDTSLYTKIAANAIVAMEVGYEQTIGTDDLSLKYFMDEVQFDFKTEPKVVGTKVVINSSWSAQKTGSSTEKAKVELTNTIASYA